MKNRIFLLSLLAFMLATFVLPALSFVRAQVPFYGIVDPPRPYVPAPPPAVSPPTPPLCPAHFPIRRNSKTISPYMGLYFLPGPIFQYRYGQYFTGSNLFLAIGKSGVSIIGKVTAVPYPTCTTPYPVLPAAAIIDIYSKQTVYFLGNSQR